MLAAERIRSADELLKVGPDSWMEANSSRAETGRHLFWSRRSLRFLLLALQHFNLILAGVSDVLHSPTFAVLLLLLRLPHNNLSERRQKIAG